MGYGIWLLFCLSFITAWFTHVIYCFNIEAWGLLIAGAVLAPIAVFHGVYLWFT
jgi:hypothetical protein|tara:strand:- start:56 stop:217 length:162 start_codon:yes stop_codon:yes gene_type:complete